MRPLLSPENTRTTDSGLSLYIIELELELDRLRRKNNIVRQTIQNCLMDLKITSRNDGPVLDQAQILTTTQRIGESLRALSEEWQDSDTEILPVDHVAEIPVRRIVNNVFEFQKQMQHAFKAKLFLDVDFETIEWFPLRFTHIVDNIISNSLRFRDPNCENAQVNFSLRSVSDAYELEIADNGVGIPVDQMLGLKNLSNRPLHPGRGTPGVGLSVVKILVEHCCGKMKVSSQFGCGTVVFVSLPRFVRNDHVET